MGIETWDARDAGEKSVGIVFTDVDGTLVDADHHPIASTAPVMREVAERVPVCLVSARSPEGLYPIHEALGFTGPIACFSGGLVLDADGSEIFSRTFPTDVARDAKDLIDRELPQLAVGTYGHHEWIVDDRSNPLVAQLAVGTYGHHEWIVDDRSNPLVAREEYFVQASARESGDIEGTFGETGVHKLLVMGEPEPILAAEALLSERYPRLSVVRSNANLCEVMVRGVSKSQAVRLICEHEGIDAAGAVAFGDAPNDLDMMGAVERSFAMANAEDAVKEAASAVLPWSNVEAGVARALERLVLGRA